MREHETPENVSGALTQIRASFAYLARRYRWWKAGKPRWNNPHWYTRGGSWE